MTTTTSNTLEQLTVLVSYYNKEDFISGLITTLQELVKNGCNVEILDDGSSENSSEILIRNVKHLPTPNKVRLTKQINQGSAFTRNELINRVQTKYFMFLDADDEIKVDNLLNIFPELMKRDSDLLVTGFETNGNSKDCPMPFLVSTMTEFELKPNSQIYQSMGYWRYVYKTETIRKKHIRFTPTKTDLRGLHFILDDVFWMIQISELEGKILVTPRGKEIYNWKSFPFNKESRYQYRKQEILMPRATRVYLRIRAESTSLLTINEKNNLMFNLKACFQDLTPKQRKLSGIRFIWAAVVVLGFSARKWRISKVCRKVPL